MECGVDVAGPDEGGDYEEKVEKKEEGSVGFLLADDSKEVGREMYKTQSPLMPPKMQQLYQFVFLFVRIYGLRNCSP